MNAAIREYQRLDREGLAAEAADPEGYTGDGGACRAALATCPWWYRAFWWVRAITVPFAADDSNGDTAETR